jgi:hypothetical protein
MEQDDLKEVGLNFVHWDQGTMVSAQELVCWRLDLLALGLFNFSNRKGGIKLSARLHHKIL